VRSLRMIASIGEVHRSTQDDDEPDSAAFLAQRARIVGRIGPSTASSVASTEKNAAVGTDESRAGEGRPALEEPRRWGHLTLRERVGSGVFGEVYRAYDDQLDRDVALKLLRTGTRSAD